MTTQQKQKALYIGIDVHKDTHTAVGISPFGEKLFELTIGNYKSDFENLESEVKKHSGVLSPFFGLEDVRGYGERLAEHLHQTFPVYHVPSILVDRLRQNATHPEKSDSLDALGVAKVMMQSIDSLPQYSVSEESQKAKQLKEISIDREDLVLERTRLKNQVHTLLYRIYNNEYTTYFKDPFSLKALSFWSKARPKCDPFLLKTMRRKVRRIRGLHCEIQELEKDMDVLLTDNYTLQTASGVGVVLASTIIGEIGDITKFSSPGALSKYAGCSPRECSSGKKNRHRKTRSGNRRLNCAFHRMALSQISRSGNDRARAYFKRKVSEGKSKLKQIESGHYRVILSTGQFFGEGIDIRGISCLLLAFPFSFEGKLVQYIGRLRDIGEQKTIVDYRDSQIPFLDKQFKQRERHYKKLKASIKYDLIAKEN